MEDAFINITKKIALLLSKTKDTILADFKNEVISIDFSSEIPEGASFEDISEIVERIFTKIGIDFSNSDNLEKLANNLGEAVKTIESIGNTLAEIKDVDSVNSLISKFTPVVKEIITIVKNFSDTSVEEIKTELKDAIEGFDYEALIRRIVNYVLMTLLKNARTVFADEIRLIEITAQEIIDDVEGIIETVGDTIGDIKDEVKGTYEKISLEIDAFQETVTKEIKQEISEIRDRLCEESADKRNELLELIKSPEASNIIAKIAHAFSITYSILDFVGIISHKKYELKVPEGFVNSLKTAKETVENKVKNVGEKVDSQFSKLAAPMNISRSSVSTSALQLATLNLIQEKVSSPAKDALDALTSAGETVMADIAQAATTLNNSVDGILDKIENFSYPVEIVILDWSKTKSLFTQPIKHFRELYPIDSFEDAKDLIQRFTDLLHLINPDIPDFSTLISLLEGLLKKLKDKFMLLVKEAKDEVKEFLLPLIEKIQQIIAILKDVAKDIKGEFEDIIENLKVIINAIGSQIAEVSRLFTQEISALADEAEGALENIVDGAKATLEDIKEKSLEGLEDVGEEISSIIKEVGVNLPSLKGFDLHNDVIKPALLSFAGIDLELDFEAETAAKLKKSIEDRFKTIASDSKQDVLSWTKEVSTSIQAVVSPSIWKERLDSVLSQLKEEAENDMNSITSLISADGAKQLITNFNSTKQSLVDSLDINSYVNIFKTALNDVILPNPELYYTSFKTLIKDQIFGRVKDNLKELEAELTEAGSDIKGKFEERWALISSASDEALTTLIEEFASTVWKKLKSKLVDPIINNIKQILITVARRVIRIAITKILDEIAKNNDFIKGAINAAKEEYKEEIDFTVDTLKSIGTYLTSEMSFTDTMNLAVSIYRRIPSDFKDTISDIIPPLPDEITNYCKDLEYESDLNNLFVNITLFDLSKLLKGSSSESKLDASVKLGLTIDIEDYIVEKIDEQNNITTPGVYFYLTLNSSIAHPFEIGDKHVLKLGASCDLGKTNTESPGEGQTLGFCLTKKLENGGYFHGLFKPENISALLYAYFNRTSTAEQSNILSTKYIDINIKDYPQIFYLGYNPGLDTLPEEVKDLIKKENTEGFQLGYLGALNDLEFIVKLRENPLFKQILKDDLAVLLSTHLGYDLKDGLMIGGGCKVQLDFDLNNLKIGNLTFNSANVELGSKENDFGSLILNLNTTFQINFEAVQLAFENLGVGFNTRILNPDYTFASPNFDADFNFPTSIGISVEAPGVTGGGLISIDTEKGEFSGFFELSVIDKFGVSAYFICNTGAKEGQIFSLIAMLSTSFSPGIPLGMGFSLTAIGGCLGLNRGIDRENLIKAVRQGTLATAFFVKDLQKNLSVIRSTTEGLFPVRQKQFYFGVLGRISFEPILTCDFGLILQLPNPVEIIIVGALKVSAGDSLDDIISINVYFAGGLNFEEGLWFDASIVDSRIVGISLEGDMAFRLFWGGASKGFLLSIGGFHPAYKPEEGMMVSDMKRLSMGLDYGIVKIKLETYLAVTSNSFQIGADLTLNIGWESFGIHGYAGFDTLFQFDPFLFMFDIRAGVAVTCGGWELLAIHLALELSGPAPWRAAGSASFNFIFIPISIGFDIEWGDSTPELPSTEISVLELLDKEIKNVKNWSVKEALTTNGVQLREDQGASTSETDTIIVQPFSSISFNQSSLPFVTKDSTGDLTLTSFEKMDICNNARIVDYCSIKLEGLTFRSNNSSIHIGESLTMEHNDFAPSLYKLLSIEDKIKSKSYVKYNSGFTFTPPKSSPKEGRELIFEVEHSFGFEEPKSPNKQSSSSSKSRAFTRRDNASFQRYINQLDNLNKQYKIDEINKLDNNNNSKN